jgi:hypothetical protein
VFWDKRLALFSGLHGTLTIPDSIKFVYWNDLSNITKFKLFSVFIDFLRHRNFFIKSDVLQSCSPWFQELNKKNFSPNGLKLTEIWPYKRKNAGINLLRPVEKFSFPWASRTGAIIIHFWWTWAFWTKVVTHSECSMLATTQTRNKGG